MHIARERVVGHRQVADAHLLAIALAREARLATFDRAIRSIVPPPVRPDDAVVVLADG